jgi:hypothetical protein
MLMPEEQQSATKSPKEQETKKAIQQNITYTQPPGGLPSVYANNCALSPNPFELRLYFGEMASSADDSIVIAQKVEVIVSWVEAKIVATFLQKTIEAFEKKNGPITLPSMPDPPKPANPFGEDSKAEIIASRILKPAPHTP